MRRWIERNTPMGEPKAGRLHAAVTVPWHPIGSENAKRLPDGKAFDTAGTVFDRGGPPLVAVGHRRQYRSRSAAGSLEWKPSKPLASLRIPLYREVGGYASTFSDVIEKSHNSLGGGVEPSVRRRVAIAG